MDQPTPAATASAQAAPDDRATTFRAVEGGSETRSGTVLLVEAYAAIWLILMGWMWMLWRKQRSLHARLDGVEKALDRAAAGKK